MGFTLWNDALLAREANDNWSLLQGLTDFREHLGGELCVTILQDLGVGLDVNEIDASRVLNAVDWLSFRKFDLAA